MLWNLKGLWQAVLQYNCKKRLQENQWCVFKTTEFGKGKGSKSQSTEPGCVILGCGARTGTPAKVV